MDFHLTFSLEFNIYAQIFLSFCAVIILRPRDETHNPPLLTRLGSTGLVKKANMVGEDDLVSEYLMSRLSREYVIFHDKTL